MRIWWGGSLVQPINRVERRDVLIDVSRLVWRWWRGGLPTGVDRVCLAYAQHFRSRARAVVQRGGRHFVFDEAHSEQLFDAFDRGPAGFRSRFAALAAKAFVRGRANPLDRGLLYLNLGHTGLNEPSLPRWVEQNGLRAIYFVHDLIPLTHPQFCRPAEAEKHARRIENVLASASGVIGNSQATIDELAAFAADRRLIMPPALASFIAGPPVPAKFVPAVLDRPHFITVGTIEGRKNHILLLRIWERLARRYGADTPVLVIAGQRGWEASEALAMLDGSALLKKHVRELGTCADHELASLIAGARALLMPSFAEGFGLPVAEALALGTPVIASDLPVFREFAADIPTYLDPLDDRAWEAAIVGFAGESAERKRQCKAMKGFKPATWTSHFAAVEAWLDTIA
jgi:glycosyltransferase involved in cell wall biosynthesis